MSQPDPLLAQRCMLTAALDQQIAAWKQALEEFGIPDHPGGKCPGPSCRCSAMAELITFRAYELMGLPPEQIIEDAAEAVRIGWLLNQYRKKED